MHYSTIPVRRTTGTTGQPDSARIVHAPRKWHARVRKSHVDVESEPRRYTQHHAQHNRHKRTPQSDPLRSWGSDTPEALCNYLAKGRRSATLGKNAWFIGNGQSPQEQPVHWKHGQSPPGGPHHQRGTGDQHHHSSRVKPTVVNGTSPAAVTTAHRQRKTTRGGYPTQVGVLWQPSKHTAVRAWEGQHPTVCLTQKATWDVWRV